jgi:hypothetical protein
MGLPKLSTQVPAAALVEARRRYPCLASSVAASVDAILEGRQRHRGGPQFLLDAFGWDLAGIHDRLDLLELCLSRFLRAEVPGAERKRSDLGRADRQTWVSLYSELTMARALEVATGGRVVAFDPASEGGRRADVLLELAGVRTLVEICSPRPADEQQRVLDYPGRLMEALKRVEVGAHLRLLGCDDLEPTCDLPSVQAAVRRYRRWVTTAADGETLELGGGIAVRLVGRDPDGEVCVGGGVTAIAVGNGPRLAAKCCEETRQLASDRPGLVVADLSSQSEFCLDPWDPGLAEAAFDLAQSPPSRGDAVLAVRSPVTRAGLARFPRLLLWQRAGVASSVVSALGAGPVLRESVRSRFSGRSS